MKYQRIKWNGWGSKNLVVSVNDRRHDYTVVRHANGKAIRGLAKRSTAAWAIRRWRRAAGLHRHHFADADKQQDHGHGAAQGSHYDAAMKVGVTVSGFGV